MEKKEQNKTLNISEFISVAIQLELESAKIIDEIQKSNTKNVSMKGINDPVTQADIKCQTLIIKGIYLSIYQIC